MKTLEQIVQESAELQRMLAIRGADLSALKAALKKPNILYRSLAKNKVDTHTQVLSRLESFHNGEAALLVSDWSAPLQELENLIEQLSVADLLLSLEIKRINNENKEKLQEQRIHSFSSYDDVEARVRPISELDKQQKALRQQIKLVIKIKKGFFTINNNTSNYKSKYVAAYGLVGLIGGLVVGALPLMLTLGLLPASLAMSVGLAVGVSLLGAIVALTGLAMAALGFLHARSHNGVNEALPPRVNNLVDGKEHQAYKGSLVFVALISGLVGVSVGALAFLAVSPVISSISLMASFLLLPALIASGLGVAAKLIYDKVKEKQTQKVVATLKKDLHELSQRQELGDKKEILINGVSFDYNPQGKIAQFMMDATRHPDKPVAKVTGTFFQRQPKAAEVKRQADGSRFNKAKSIAFPSSPKNGA